jgi:hypothetical protein
VIRRERDHSSASFRDSLDHREKSCYHPLLADTRSLYETGVERAINPGSDPGRDCTCAGGASRGR